jgi:hypothetical protein
MENLVNSRDAQFHLDRRDSSELERYFVGGLYQLGIWEIMKCDHGLTCLQSPLAWSP